MKKYTLRTIKVLSSFVVISMVLISTVAMPVLAAENGIYKLSDYIVDMNSSGNEISVHYEIDGDQIIRAYYQDGTSTLHGDHHIYSPSSTETKINFRVYPLGTQKIDGSDMTTGVIDVSDIMTPSFLRMSSQFYFKMDFWSNFNDGYADTSGYTNSFWYIFCYDANGKYLNTVKSAPIVSTINVNTSSIEFWPLRTTVFIELPVGTKYITPTMLIGTYLPTDSARVSKIEVFAQPFRLTVFKDALIEESLSAQRVEQALADIESGISNGFSDLESSIDGGFADIDESINKGNQQVVDKMDEVIEGRDEWADQAQDKYEEQRELESEANKVMDNIDAGTDLDEILPDSAHSQEDLEDQITSWKGTDAWQQWKYVLSSLLDDSSVGEILLMLVAFINISVLLIGR